MMIKNIETEYNGYKFRSRLEARWAVFFDAAGIKYEYEPEGFDLGNGLRYLPDFKIRCRLYDLDNTCYENVRDYVDGTVTYIKSLDNEGHEYLCKDNQGMFIGFREGTPFFIEFILYVEVKGDMKEEDLKKIRAFSKHAPIIVLGNIPNDWYERHENDDFFTTKYILFFNKIKQFKLSAPYYEYLDEFNKDIANLNICDFECYERNNGFPQFKEYSNVELKIAKQARFEYGVTKSADFIRGYANSWKRKEKLQLDLNSEISTLNYYSTEFTRS